MAEVKKLSGGEPTPSEILVNVDGTTIKGDGSRNFPLHATGSGGALLPVLPTVTPGLAGTTNLTANRLAVVNLVNGGAQSLQFPAASSVPNGTPLAFVFLNGQAGSSLSLLAAGGDTIHTALAERSFGSPAGYGTDSYISDGVSGWWEAFV